MLDQRCARSASRVEQHADGTDPDQRGSEKVQYDHEFG
jgi:hypothetical protein